MSRLISVYLLFFLTLGCHAAFAEDWKVQSLDGSVRAFANAEWTHPAVGAPLPKAALLQTDGDGVALIARGDDKLSVDPESKIRIEGAEPSQTLVRVFQGVLGAAETAGAGKRFLVMTTHASFDAKGAVFGVATDAAGTTLTVRKGLVSATDLVTRKTVDVTDGEVFRARGRAGAPSNPAANDPVAAAAKAAASRASGDAPGAEASSAAPGADRLDRNATGAIKPGAANAKTAEDAAGAVHEERRKAKLGKADARTAAAVASIERDLAEGVDVETEPWQDDFKWTQVESGEVRLKPIWRIILGLSGAEAYEFWALFLLISLMLGGVTNAVLKEAGFGAVLNGVVVILAFATAILVRDAFFRGGDNVSLEPYLSVGMMLGAMPALLLSGAFAKLRLAL